MNTSKLKLLVTGRNNLRDMINRDLTAGELSKENVALALKFDRNFEKSIRAEVKRLLKEVN